MDNYKDNNDSINTDKILIEELEQELSIAKRWIEDNSKKSHEWKKIIKSMEEESEAKLKETREYYEGIINGLYEEKMELEKKLHAIEGSRSYKVIKKVKGMLGGKNE